MGAVVTLNLLMYLDHFIRKIMANHNDRLPGR